MSSVDAGTAVLKIKPDYDGASESVASEGKGVFGGLGKSMALAFAGGFVIDKGISLFKDSIAEARESIKVAAQTAQVIQSTGGAAGISAKQVEDLATKLSNLTGIDDETIQSTENLLLTFTNIKDLGGDKNIFSRATGLVQDMSVAFKQDGSASAVQLGKALQDPIKGVTALQRVGVTFTADQKKVIKALVDTGDVAGAQKIILDELAKEVGGSAAAQADPLQKLGVQWKNIEETIGLAVLPIVNKLVTILANNLPAALGTVSQWFHIVDDGVQSFLYTFRTGFTEDEGTPLESIALAARDVAGVFTDDLMPIIRTVGGFLGDNLEPIVIGVGVALAGMAGSAALGAVIGGLTALVGVLASPIVLLGVLAAGIVFAYQKSETFRDIVTGAFDLAGKAISGATDLVKDIGGAVSDAAKTVEKSGLKDKLVEAGDRARDSFKGATSAVDDLGSHAVDAGAKIKGSDLMGAISGVDLPDPGAPSSFWSRTGQAIFGVINDMNLLASNAGNMGSAFLNGISGPFDAVGAKASEVFSGVKANVGDAGSNLLGFVGTYGQPFVEDWRRVWDDVGAINRGTVDAFKIAWNDLFSDKSLIDLVRDEASNAMGVLRSGFDIGMAQVQTIWSVNWSGILSTAMSFGSRMASEVAGDVGRVVGFFAGMPGRILGALGNLGGLLPQKGQEVVQGLQSGATVSFNIFRGWLAGLGGLVVGAVGNLGRSLYDKGVQLIQGFINGIKDKALQIPGVVAGAIKSTPGGFLAGKLGIPGFAVGGIIDRPMIAQLHSNEVVIPLSRPARAMELAQQSGLLDMLGEMWDANGAVTNDRYSAPPAPAAPQAWPAPVVNQTIMVHDVREGAMQAADEWWWAQKTAGV